MLASTLPSLLALLLAIPSVPTSPPIPADPVVTTVKIKSIKTETIFTGDGTVCATIKVDNKGTQGHIEIKITYANGSEGNAIEIGAGQSLPVICNVQKITAKAVGADTTVETTSQI
jgi:hypothetical protein